MKTRRHEFTATLILASSISMILSGCAHLLEISPSKKEVRTIKNPFPPDVLATRKSENIILRTKKGDRAVEVELPGGTADMTNFEMPVAPRFHDGQRTPAGDPSSESFTRESLRELKPSLTDREITDNFPQTVGEDPTQLQNIEQGLGLVSSEQPIPQRDTSYLAALDWIKQLYKKARFEAALVEIDGMLKAYPTDSHLYMMRGTLLDRIGKSELAIKSWTQALRLNPSNASLRKFIEKKEARRRIDPNKETQKGLPE